MIKEFQGPYRWLSNFASVNIKLNNINYPSVEHAYMSAKSDSPGWKRTCSASHSPGHIKRLSRTIVLKPNWHDIKVDVMRECLIQKFNQEPFKTLLIDTGDIHIQEGNMWNDKFWGVCLKTNIGLNMLGQIIMDIRMKLKEEKL